VKTEFVIPAPNTLSLPDAAGVGYRLVESKACKLRIVYRLKFTSLNDSTKTHWLLCEGGSFEFLGRFVSGGLPFMDQ